jgi:simple sugar transport system permease protein
VDLTAALVEATVRAGTPLALASLGEVLIERSGVINIGLEGSVLAGAFGAAVVAQALGADAGIIGGAIAGALIGALFAVFAVSLRINQVIAGTAMTLLALGLTGSLSRTLFGQRGIALTLPTLSATEIPGLRSLPIVGAALFAQPYIVYLAVLGTLAMHWWLSRTHAGLALRAVGESPVAAIAAGIDPDRVRWLAILVGCALAGLSGAVLVLAQSGTFVEGMSAGRGYIAIAIVALGRWRPLRVLLGACLFGASMALQFTAQALDWRLPYQLFLAAPYLVTLAVLVVTARGSTPPAALGSSRNDV